MAVTVLSKKQKLGILKQTDFATPQAAGAAFKTIYCDIPINFDPDISIDQRNQTSANGVHFETERRKVDAVSGFPSISATGSVDKATFAALLYAAIFSVTEDATTPYNKLYNCTGLSGTLDFNGDAGPLFTLGYDRKGSADDGVLLKTAILDTFGISLDINQRGQSRDLKFNAKFVGGSYADEQTLNGTWTNTSGITSIAPDSNWTNQTFTVDSVDYSGQCMLNWSLNINNRVSKINATSGSACQFFIMPEYTSRILILRNDTTEKISGDLADNATVAQTFGNDALAAYTDGKFTFAAAHGVLISHADTTYNDYAALELNIRWESASAATPFSINWCDTIDWGY